MEEKRKKKKIILKKKSYESELSPEQQEALKRRVIHRGEVGEQERSAYWRMRWEEIRAAKAGGGLSQYIKENYWKIREGVERYLRERKELAEREKRAEFVEAYKYAGLGRWTSVDVEWKGKVEVGQRVVLVSEMFKRKEEKRRYLLVEVIDIRRSEMFHDVAMFGVVRYATRHRDAAELIGHIVQFYGKGGYWKNDGFVVAEGVEEDRVRGWIERNEKGEFVRIRDKRRKIKLKLDKEVY